MLVQHIWVEVNTFQICVLVTTFEDMMKKRPMPVQSMTAPPNSVVAIGIDTLIFGQSDITFDWGFHHKVLQSKMTLLRTRIEVSIYILSRKHSMCSFT